MKQFYWRCCSEEEVSCTDVQDAKAQLELHEKAAHKGKPTGAFGWKQVTIVKASWAIVQVGLDALLFGELSFAPTEDRSIAIEKYLSSNGWNWDMVLDHIIMDDTICA